MPDNKLVIFGAGKIGRSFIGQLFSVGGYEVVFIDVIKPVIDELNSKRSYKVVFSSEEKEEIIDVRNVRGVNAENKQKVAYEVGTASIVAVSVGLNGLKKIFPLLAKGLLERYKRDKKLPLDIIIAENQRNADVLFRTELSGYLPLNYPFDELVGLVETSIGKMVPIMNRKDMQKDILKIIAEPYNTLILSKKAFKNPIPDIKGLAPKDNIKAWVDRKLFIHNLGHAISAYIGYLYSTSFIYIYEALAVREIYGFVRAAMKQSADILRAKYPEEFTSAAINEHIIDLLERFQNKALGDTIFRVGCDLNRKLSANDRLAGIIHVALKHNLPYDKILFALVCASRFKAKDEIGNMLKSDIEFVNHYKKGIKSILTKICEFDEIEHKQLFIKAEKFDKQINHTFRQLLI